MDKNIHEIFKIIPINYIIIDLIDNVYLISSTLRKLNKLI